MEEKNISKYCFKFTYITLFTKQIVYNNNEYIDYETLYNIYDIEYVEFLLVL